MKIVLEAFVDNNFGDNLFVYIVASKYPEHTFYMFEKAEYRESYRILNENVENVCLVDEKEKNSFLKHMDAMFIVGGDMFGDKADYSTLLKQIRAIKKRGGIVAFLGISLFKYYSRVTWFDFQILFSQADIVVVRERETYNQLKKKIPWANIVASADMAFSTDVTEIKKEPSQKNILGVSVRRKVQTDSELFYPQYCAGIAEIVCQYLEESKDYEVKFLAFSSGKFDDRIVVEDIMNLCPACYRDRMNCVSFSGDVRDYMIEIQRCDKMLCTRFHALVFAILLNKPFIPIVYEEKMERLLNEIGYYGIRPNYEKKLHVVKILSEFSERAYSKKQLKYYMDKANHFFDGLDESMKIKKINICGTIWNSMLYNIYIVKEFMLNKIYRKYVKNTL